jgi:hypothetical protein
MFFSFSYLFPLVSFFSPSLFKMAMPLLAFLCFIHAFAIYVDGSVTLSTPILAGYSTAYVALVAFYCKGLLSCWSRLNSQAGRVAFSFRGHRLNPWVVSVLLYSLCAMWVILAILKCWLPELIVLMVEEFWLPAILTLLIYLLLEIYSLVLEHIWQDISIV